MSSLRRICLYGGPGSGKSTTSHFIMWRLKSMGVSAEFINEFVKLQAYAQDEIDPILQPLVTSRQLQAEVELLEAGAQVIVTESPTLLGAVYDRRPCAVTLWISTERELAKRWPTLNLFIDRGKKTYEQRGRYESEAQAKSKDAYIKKVLDDSNQAYTIVRYGEWDTLTRIIHAHS